MPIETVAKRVRHLRAYYGGLAKPSGHEVDRMADPGAEGPATYFIYAPGRRSDGVEMPFCSTCFSSCFRLYFLISYSAIRILI
jgi:hypothetical protein